MSGIALSLLRDRLFHRAGTTIKPFEESTSLVTQGVFRLSRNPMYLGFILLLAVAAFLMGSLAPFLVIPLFIFLIYTLFITIEEKMLTEKVGKSYLDYQKRVRRWI